jgi:hypothetical protein
MPRKMKERKIDVELSTEFHCTLCGQVASRIHAHSTYVFVKNSYVLPTHNEKILLTMICKGCFDELEAIKRELEAEAS